jgi:hypothetical protein
MRCVCNDPECDAWFPPNSREPKLGVLNYCFDLNAMHEAEKVLTPGQSSHYAGTLRTLLGFHQHTYFDLAHATAPQRAEAFLRCIGKWRE